MKAIRFLDSSHEFLLILAETSFCNVFAPRLPGAGDPLRVEIQDRDTIEIYRDLSIK